MTAFGAEARALWALPADIAFLNHGSYGAVPHAVLEARIAWLRKMETQPLLWTEWARLEGIAAAAAAIAPRLGAVPGDLVFVDNATSGINAVLRSLVLRPGDRLVTTTHVYPAVARTLAHVAARAGAEVVHADVPFPLVAPEQVVEALAAVLTGGERVAVVDWITSSTGAVFPVHALVELCRDAGVPVLVDAAHAPGHVPMDLASLGADWTVGNLHKWMFAPRGCAVLHAQPARQQGLVPTVVSHGQSFVDAFAWLGTRDPTPWLCAPDAVTFYDGLGERRVHEWIHGLRRDAASLLSDAWGTAVPVSDGLLGAMATLEPPCWIPPTEAAAQVVHDALWERHRIEVPVVPFGDRSWLRISAQVYNALGEFERLAAALGPDGVR